MARSRVRGSFLWRSALVFVVLVVLVVGVGAVAVELLGGGEGSFGVVGDRVEVVQEPVEEPAVGGSVEFEEGWWLVLLVVHDEREQHRVAGAQERAFEVFDVADLDVLVARGAVRPGGSAGWSGRGFGGRRRRARRARG